LLIKKKNLRFIEGNRGLRERNWGKRALPYDPKGKRWIRETTLEPARGERDQFDRRKESRGDPRQGE